MKKDIHAKWSDARAARLDSPDAQAGYDAAGRECCGGEPHLPRRRTAAETVAYREAGRAEQIARGIPAEAIDAFIADAKQVADRERQENEA